LKRKKNRKRKLKRSFFGYSLRIRESKSNGCRVSFRKRNPPRGCAEKAKASWNVRQESRLTNLRTQFVDLVHPQDARGRKKKKSDLEGKGLWQEGVLRELSAEIGLRNHKLQG